jgi:hypothetical protein
MGSAGGYLMMEIDALFERLDHDNVDLIRLDIVDLIGRCLNEKRESFGYWEKKHFAHAIAELARNVHAPIILQCQGLG